MADADLDDTDLKPDDTDGGTVITAEEGIEDLRAKLVAEQEARRQAEAAASQASQVATHSIREKEQGDIALIQSAITQVQSDAARLKREYADAAKAGNTDRMAELQFEISENVSNLQQLRHGAEALAERAKRPPERQPVQPMARAPDPVEDVAKTLTPRSADWVRRHPDYVTDAKKSNQMLAAHYAAVAAGHVADSDAYFQAVEQQLGLTADSRETTNQSPRRAPPPPPAPGRGGSGGETRTVRLTPEQRQIAQISGLSDEEYLRNLENARQRGEIATR